MKKVLLALLGLHVLRLLMVPAFDLAPQEAYYFLYAQHPALSYFDHPPAVAWLLTPLSALLGRSVWAPRLTAWLATLATGVAFALLAARVLPRARRGWALLVIGTTLLASIVSLIITPDVPLLLFWTLSLLLLHRALFDGSRASWLGAGLCIGLAFDGKYTAVFLPFGLLLFLLASPRHRRWLRTPWPYLAGLVALVATLPVLVWNARNGFASFVFQSSGRASNVGGLGVVNFGKLLATQSFLLLPPLLVAVVWAMGRGARIVARRKRDLATVPNEGRRLKPRLLQRSPPSRAPDLGDAGFALRRSREQLLFLLCFSLPPVVLFGGLSFFSLVKPNWLMPAWICGTLLAVRLFRSPLLWKVNVALGLTVLAATAFEVLTYAVPIRSDDTWFGWKELARAVEQRAQEEKVGFVFSADDYKTTAELRFYSEVPAFAANVLGRRALEFDYLGEDLSRLLDRDALFLDSRPTDLGPDPAGTIPEDLRTHFASVEERPPILLRSGGRIVRKFLVFRASGYRGPAL